MRRKTVKIKIRVMRSNKYSNLSSCKLWTDAARGLADIWDRENYV